MSGRLFIGSLSVGVNCTLHIDATELPDDRWRFRAHVCLGGRIEVHEADCPEPFPDLEFLDVMPGAAVLFGIESALAMGAAGEVQTFVQGLATFHQVETAVAHAGFCSLTQFDHTEVLPC